ncbi:hypothetical protein [Actinomycetospora flava]|uniref:Uncharacterized protein n=1 Tax=Actinomycetospora flava TaxID=3129232 RepID=A0ABU8M8W3_9PSEU
MHDDPSWWLDDAGPSSRPSRTGCVKDALELACEELNFKQSLVSEACVLRDQTLRVLTDMRRHYERSVRELDRLVDVTGPGPRQERLRAAADRGRANLESTRQRCRALLDLDLGEPRALA